MPLFLERGKVEGEREESELFFLPKRERGKNQKTQNAPVRVVDGPALGPVLDAGDQRPEPAAIERRVGLEQPKLFFEERGEKTTKKIS